LPEAALKIRLGRRETSDQAHRLVRSPNTRAAAPLPGRN
jgi:hypothetical protein